MGDNCHTQRMDETRSTDRARLSRPLGVAAAVLLVIAAGVAVTAVARSSDEPSAISTTPSSTPSGGASASPSPTMTSPSTAPGVNYAPQVRAALRDRFPALVPSRVPPGWRVSNATYARQSWTMTLKAPGASDVVLSQARVPRGDAVANHLPAGATSAGRVDLSRFGTGSWTTYAAQGGFVGLAKTLPDTTVVVSGPDQATVLTLVRQLLAAEGANDPAASEG